MSHVIGTSSNIFTVEGTGSEGACLARLPSRQLCTQLSTDTNQIGDFWRLGRSIVLQKPHNQSTVSFSDN